MSNEQKSLPLHELDTNLLFEKFTIDEIRDTEKRTRADIERKKEDLRTMVGERYRDLIEAADTITEMKNSAQKVMSTIGHMEELCTNLKQSHMIKGSSLHQKKKQEMENKRKEEARFYGVASQIKLLLDMPEKIWTCLDCEDYLTASRLFLLSQHINTSLHLDAQNAPNFLYWFPVLNRQWAAISHFKSTILQGCRRLLKEVSVSDQKIAESLCAILLLENSNPRQVFNEFLLARTSAVQQLFHPSSPVSSTKDQICLVVRLVSTTVHQIHAVFYTPEGTGSGSGDETGQPGEPGSGDTNSMPSNLLLTILTRVTSQKQNESGLLELQSSVSAKCLPQSVTDFCPSHKSFSLGLSTQHLQDNCKQWIQTCTSDVKAGVTKLLGFVNTVKHLATIRDTVFDLMSKDSSLGLWEEVCGRVLSGPLHIWEDLLRPLFVSRVKALVEHQLESAVEFSQRQISTVIMELDVADERSKTAETDLAAYIWSESVSDIAPNTAWTSAASRSLLDSGGLLMKTKAYTPVIQSLCRNFDEKLKTLQEDTCYYLYVDDDADTVNIDTPPFSRFADTSGLLAHIQGACTTGVDRILSFLQAELTDWRNCVSESTSRDTHTCNKLLLVARLCAALWELTPHLHRCMLGTSGKLERQESLRSLKKASERRGVKSEANAAWETLKSKLVQCQQTAYRIWVEHVTQVVLRDFTVAANAQSSQDLVRTTARWDEVSIEEETDDGKKVVSKIYIPLQASWYLLSLLYTLCRELNNMGGHAVARSVLQHLVYTVSDGLATVYEEILHPGDSPVDAPTLNQRRALQLLFDVKFVLLIIARKDDTEDNKGYHDRAARLVSRLEEVIDPFDLDVFSPYIQANLTRLAQRSSVLLGALTSIDKSGLYSVTSRPVASSQQEQHNVIQLSSCQNRFSLLPIATQQGRYSTPQPVIEQTLYRGVEASGPSLAEAAGATLPQPSQQKLTSSSSFYDKIGTGLGSMTEISHWFSTIGSKT